MPLIMRPRHKLRANKNKPTGGSGAKGQMLVGDTAVSGKRGGVPEVVKRLRAKRAK